MFLRSNQNPFVRSVGGGGGGELQTGGGAGGQVNASVLHPPESRTWALPSPGNVTHVLMQRYICPSAELPAWVCCPGQKEGKATMAGGGGGVVGGCNPESVFTTGTDHTQADGTHVTLPADVLLTSWKEEAWSGRWWWWGGGETPRWSCEHLTG